MKIGILGGMGPRASLEFQKMLLEATRVEREQDHLEVICYSNPKIPDRTESLQKDGGESFLDALLSSAEVLVKAEASIIAIPCNTAHSRFAEIRARVPVPVVNMVELAVRHVLRKYGDVPVGLLATSGTVGEKLYQKVAVGSGIRWIMPSRPDQKELMRVIYRLKAGEPLGEKRNLPHIAKKLVQSGAQVLLLGCTELSLCEADFAQVEAPIVDPMRILAGYLAEMGRGGVE